MRKMIGYGEFRPARCEQPYIGHFHSYLHFMSYYRFTLPVSACIIPSFVVLVFYLGLCLIL